MTVSRKALFFDVDGTLLSEVTKTVPDSAKEAVKKAREKGHLVFINSGRTSCLLDPIRALIDVDGYCCGCGTRVIAGDKVLYSYTIPHDKGIELKKEILKHNLDGVLEGTEACYFRKETSRIARVEELRSSISTNGNASPMNWEDHGYEYDKFCLLADGESDIAGMARAVGDDFEIINRGGGFYEFVPAGHSKAGAIEFVMNHYGIDLKDVYVFGDSTNDLSMFEFAKNCIVMGHHDVELEPYATFFTKNVEADGVAYAMEKLHLI